MANETGASGKGIERGLGKGLDALIRETGNALPVSSVQTLPINDVLPNPSQPRRRFSEEALDDLASSIRSQGVLQPLLVRPSETFGKYEIVAGERRWRASRLAGLTEVPVLVRTLSDMESLSAALIENLQREDLSPVEEALGLQTLKEDFGLSQEALAQRLGKSRSTIANSLRLLSLPEDFRADLSDGRLSAGHARALLSITDAEAQEELRARILEQELSVREAEGLAAVWKETGAFFVAVAKRERPSEGSAPRTGNGFAEIAAPPRNAAPIEAAALDVPDDGAGIKDMGTIASRSIPRATRPKNKPQSARLMEIQSRITSVLQVPVKVTGKESKGKISLTYSSREELNAIVKKLTLLAEETSAPAQPASGTVEAHGAEATESSPQSEFIASPPLEGAEAFSIQQSAAEAPLSSPASIAGIPGLIEAISSGELSNTASDFAANAGAVSEISALGEALPLEDTPEVYLHLAEATAGQTRVTTPKAVTEAVSIAEQLLAVTVADKSTPENEHE